MRFTLIISLVLSIFAVIFALQNPQVAEVEVGTLAFRGSTALILLVTFALGVVVGLLGALPGWIRNRRKVNALRKTIAEERVETTQSRARTTESAPPATPESAPTEETGRTPSHPETKDSSRSK